MNPPAFCTIITPDYLPYALALYDSLEKNRRVDFDMHVFVACKMSEFKLPKIGFTEVKFLFVEELCNGGIGAAIFNKYYPFHLDEFRWAMKSVLIKNLIQSSNYEKVVYVDSDIFFFGDYTFLLDALDHSTLLLTPHWRASNPLIDPSNFQLLFNNGLYNAGFVAANKNAVAAMDWWGSVCLYRCEKDLFNGYFDDQAYLDLFHILFEGVEVVQHRGCNIANWNQVDCNRVKKEDSQVWINDKYPIVFIHFTKSTILGILSGEDYLLHPYLEEYSAILKKHSSGFDIIAKYKDQLVPHPPNGL